MLAVNQGKKQIIATTTHNPTVIFCSNYKPVFKESKLYNLTLFWPVFVSETFRATFLAQNPTLKISLQDKDTSQNVLVHSLPFGQKP
jgi:hypothetical protein